MSKNSYPTVKEETLQYIVDLFKKKGWTWQSKDKFPTKGQIKDALNDDMRFLIDNPDVPWISGGRLCIVRHSWFKTHDFIICVELEEIEDIPRDMIVQGRG